MAATFKGIVIHACGQTIYADYKDGKRIFRTLSFMSSEITRCPECGIELSFQDTRRIVSVKKKRKEQVAFH